MSDRPDQQPKQRSRLESEVFEILERTDRPPSNVIKFKAKVRSKRPSLRSRLPDTEVLRQPLTLLAASLLLAIFAVTVEGGSAIAARVFGFISLVSFISLYVIGWRDRRNPPGIKRWRGRDMEFRPPRRWN